MPGIVTSAESPRTSDVRFYRVKRGEYIGVTLDDGRMIGIPLSLFPTLLAAKPRQRAKWRLIGKGHGVHWPDLDLDLSTEGLIAARPDTTAAARTAIRSSDVSTQVLHTLLSSHGEITVSELAALLAERYPKDGLRRLLKDIQKRLSPDARPRSVRKRSA